VKIMRLLPAAACVVALPCHAAILRPFTQLNGPAVRLADLFDDLGSTPDRVLGAAPAPGVRIVVNSPQLAAIARDFNVDWRPTSGGEQAVIERRGDVLMPSAINTALRRSLADAGAPDDCDVASPDLQPIEVPAGAAVHTDVSQVSYEAQSGHFSAMLSVSAPDMVSVQARISGQVIPMVQTAVASHRLAPGGIVGEGDMQLARVRLASLRGGTALLPEAAIGLSARHVVAAGQALSANDLVRPPMVLRGSTVRMTLETEGIALSAQGIATQTGARGDRIRVENPGSHLLVDAEVVGEGEVRVSPRGSAITLVSSR
jgi:flagella basal body P-ring formation protein FlgA